MATLPNQVRKQAEAANKFYEPAEPTPEQTPPEDSAAGEDIKAAEAVTPKPTPEVTPAPAAESSANADHEGEQPETPPVETPPASEDWEQRYRTAQGMLKAESRQWQAERAQLREELSALRLELSRAKQAEQTPPPAPKSAITDADLETYGPELIDVIGRKAQEMAEAIVNERLEKLRPEIESTKQQVYRSNEDRFYGELSNAVPDWQVVNTDERWLQWLGQVDPLSGMPRQAYLDNAAQNLDVARTAALFTAFKESVGLGAKPKVEPEAKPAAPAKPALSPTPRTVGNASAPTHREQPATVSRDEINAHYRRASTDVSYRTSEAHKAMEQRIAEAMHTGQIT